MKRSTLLFSLMVVVQLVLLAWIIVGQERILQRGEVFLFQTAPVDPRDPFRGEYVRLEFEAEEGPWTMPDTVDYGRSDYYATLSTDSAGYAQINRLLNNPPTSGPFIKVKAMSWDGAQIDRILLPFDRYYLQEGDGPKTEDLLQPDWNDGEVTPGLPAHAIVRILDGEAVVEDLIVDGKPLREWLK